MKFNKYGIVKPYTPERQLFQTPNGHIIGYVGAYIGAAVGLMIGTEILSRVDDAIQ